jgi:hypothetical protein
MKNIILMGLCVALLMGQITASQTFDSGARDVTHSGTYEENVTDNRTWTYNPNDHTGNDPAEGLGNTNHFKQALTVETHTSLREASNIFEGPIFINNQSTLDLYYATNTFNGVITINSGGLQFSENTNTFGENCVINIEQGGSVTIRGGTISAPISLNGASSEIIWFGTQTVNRINVKATGTIKTFGNDTLLTIDILDLTNNSGTMPNLANTTTGNLIINNIIGGGTYSGDYTVGQVFATEAAYQTYLSGLKTASLSSFTTSTVNIDGGKTLTLTNAMTVAENISFAGNGASNSQLTLTGGINDTDVTSDTYLTLDRSLMASGKFVKLGLSATSPSLSKVILRIIDNGNSGLSVPLTRNVFCPPYSFVSRNAFNDYIGSYFALTSAATVSFKDIYLTPRDADSDDYIRYTGNLIKAGVSHATQGDITAANPTYADTKINFTISSNKNVGLTSDDAPVTLTQNCTLIVTPRYTLTANGKITIPSGKTLTKVGLGTFALTDIVVALQHQDAISGNLVVSGGNVSMATGATINGTLTIKPSGKLVVNGTATVGTITAAS